MMVGVIAVMLILGVMNVRMQQKQAVECVIRAARLQEMKERQRVLDALDAGVQLSKSSS